MKRLQRLSGWLLAALVLLPLGARADVWGYIDERNVAHFASEPLDARYELFFRGDDAPAAKGAAPASDTLRPVAVPTASSKLLAFFEVSTSYKAVRHLMRDAARSNGVDYELLQALIATESGFDPQIVSPKGAVGLMQIMPATAERYGVAGDAKVPLSRKLADPGINIRAGTRYLRDLIALFPGKLDVALAAYNAGEGAVQRAGNQIPAFRETQNYVRTVLQLYNTLKPPMLGSDGPSTLASGRVRMTLHGGAVGRGNMMAPLSAVTQLPEFKIERD
jgi:soluble lytic murein transglycosylase-like protein